MTASLDIWQGMSHRVVPLDADRLMLGRSSANQIQIESDELVSRLHAVLERIGEGWIIRDVGSSNGTFVNQQRVVGDRMLHSGDEIRIGATRILFRSRELSGPHTRSDHRRPDSAPPALTRREQEVLAELCRPLLEDSGYAEPASVRQIAASLSVTDAAIKQHLANLYDKFSLVTAEERRRGRLAHEAMRRGSVRF